MFLVFNKGSASETPRFAISRLWNWLIVPLGRGTCWVLEEDFISWRKSEFLVKSFIHLNICWLPLNVRDRLDCQRLKMEGGSHDSCSQSSISWSSICQKKQRPYFLLRIGNSYWLISSQTISLVVWELRGQRICTSIVLKDKVLKKYCQSLSLVIHPIYTLNSSIWECRLGSTSSESPAGWAGVGWRWMERQWRNSEMTATGGNTCEAARPSSRAPCPILGAKERFLDIEPCT